MNVAPRFKYSGIMVQPLTSDSLASKEGKKSCDGGETHFGNWQVNDVGKRCSQKYVL